jgi:hypothetical protein
MSGAQGDLVSQGAKSRMRGRKLRSTRTKEGTRVDPSRQSQAELVKKLKANARDLEKKVGAGTHQLAEAPQRLGLYSAPAIRRDTIAEAQMV